jgi:hypothetical protein
MVLAFWRIDHEMVMTSIRSSRQCLHLLAKHTWWLLNIAFIIPRDSSKRKSPGAFVLIIGFEEEEVVPAKSFNSWHR